MKSFLMVALLIAMAAAPAQEVDLDAAFEKDVLIVHASKLACYRLDIYIAENDEQRQRGLMFVKELPDTTGMLFIYEFDHRISMWMKNTFIPLDIVFVKADGFVSSVAYSTEPQSLKSIASLEPVRYVLELKAGMADKMSIDQYTRLDWQRDIDDE